MRLTLSFFAVALMSAPVAAAAPPPEDEQATHEEETFDPDVSDRVSEQAREAFRLGSALAKQGQWPEALAAFQRAARLHPHPATTFNIGYVERALGHWTRARKALLEARGPGLSPTKTEEAKAYLAEIESKLATAVVTLTTPDTAIAVDGRPLEVESAGPNAILVAGTREAGRGERPPTRTFDLRLDPGSHIFVLSREGTPDVVVSDTFAAGESVKLELGVPLSTPEPGGPAPVAVPQRPVSPGRDEGTTGRARWPAWVGFGVGAAGTAVGATYGAIALGKQSDLDDACDNGRDQCPRTDRNASLLGDLRTSSRAATAGFVVAGAGVAFGALWLLLAPDKRGASSATVTVEPIVGPRLAGIRGAF